MFRRWFPGEIPSVSRGVFMSVSVSGTRVLGSEFWVPSPVSWVLSSGFGCGHKRKWINHSTNITAIKSFSCALRADDEGTKERGRRKLHPVQDWGVCASGLLPLRFCLQNFLGRNQEHLGKNHIIVNIKGRNLLEKIWMCYFLNIYVKKIHKYSQRCEKSYKKKWSTYFIEVKYLIYLCYKLIILTKKWHPFI